MFSIDFELAHRQADALSSFAQALRESGERLQQAVFEVGRCWKGETAAQYMAKVESYILRLAVEADLCDKTAEAFLARIAEIQAAEAAAAAILAD